MKCLLYRMVNNPPIVMKKARVDNLALVPASFLLCKSEWQHIANELPPGSIFMSSPLNGKLRLVLRRVECYFKQKGHDVTFLSVRRIADRAMLSKDSYPARSREKELRPAGRVPSRV